MNEVGALITEAV